MLPFNLGSERSILKHLTTLAMIHVFDLIFCHVISANEGPTGPSSCIQMEQAPLICSV